VSVFWIILLADKKIVMRTIIFPVIFFLLVARASAADSYTVFSPNQEITLFVEYFDDGHIEYSVNIRAREVILPSSLGFAFFQPALDLTKFIRLKAHTRESDETWKPVWGEVSTIRNHYNELTLELKDIGPSEVRINIVFRVFDDGIAFRYEFPRQEKLNHFIVAEELSQFKMAGDHKAYWMPGDYDAHEFLYSTSRLSEVDASKHTDGLDIPVKTFFDNNAVQTPLMMKADNGVYINIHEAALVNYPAMNLLLDKATFTFASHLVPDAVGHKAYLQAPFKTPWRTIIMSTKAADILASKMILNLNEPSAIGDSSWIKPQKFVGVWWEMQLGKSSRDYGRTEAGSHDRHGADTANVKKYIDFASKNGMDAVLVEGWNRGWEDGPGQWKEDVFDFVTPYPDFDVDGLQAYAKAKNVQLIMHHETAASATSYERAMDTAYRFMINHGYSSLKVDYRGRIIPRGEHRSGQWMVNHYNRVVRKAADYGFILNMHQSVRPTGLHRTYPNWMTSGVARGNEFNTLTIGNTPEHETILPFTSLVGGPMDYAPGIFKIKLTQYDSSKKEQVHTTLAKQLALYVTIYSPLQMAADLPENYEAHADAFQFIKDVAVDWDDTKILEAEPGDYIVIARKAKQRQEWFLGAITDENGRNFTFRPDFLDDDKWYYATIYRDADNAHWRMNPEAYIIEKRIVYSRSVINLKLAPGGGAAISFVPLTADQEREMKKEINKLEKEKRKNK
jgi:hypothetical protein